MRRPPRKIIDGDFPMLRIVPILAAMALTSTAALAQTTSPSPSPSTTVPSASPSPSATSPSPSAATTPSAAASSPTLTDAQAKSWVGKKVYSSDNKNMGEVAQFIRDSSGKVTELQADVGGFLGIGETRVLIEPAQIKLEADRVVLNLNSDQVKALPRVAK